MTVLDPTRRQDELPPPPAASRLAALAPFVVLVALMAVAVAYFTHLTRGTSFWYDDWSFITERRGGGLEPFLRPHVDHLSLLPVAIYRVLFATVGLDDYRPYKALVLVGHCVVVGLVYLYLSRRSGGPAALLGATLVLFFGAAWQDILWAFQIAWQVSIGAGVAALIALDRRDRAGDIAACLLTGLALSSSGVGIAVALGVIVDVVLGRGRRALWIPAIPLIPYLAWWATHQESTWIAGNEVLAGTDHPILLGLLRIPSYEVGSAAGTFAGLAGLGGTGKTLSDGGTFLTYGPGLLAVALVVLVWIARRAGAAPWRRPDAARLAALLTVPVAFWAFTAMTRGVSGAPWTSRYVYVGGIFVVLFIAQLARGMRPPRWALAPMAALVAAAAISNLGDFRIAADLLRDQGGAVRGVLGAVDLAGAAVPDDKVITGLPAPGITLTVGHYREIRRDIGSPAGSLEELRSGTAPVRNAADLTLVGLGSIAAVASRAGGEPGGAAPTATIGAGTLAGSRRGCALYVPGKNAIGQQTTELGIVLPARGVQIRTGTGTTTVTAKRFAQLPQPIIGVAPGRAAVVRARADAEPRPWTVYVTSPGPLTLCRR